MISEGFLPPLAAALDSRPEFAEALAFLLAGFGVVMITLIALAFVCAAVGFLFRRYPALAGKPPPAPVRRRGHAAVAGLDPTVVAAIAAGVDQAFGGRYRITSVTRIGDSR